MTSRANLAVFSFLSLWTCQLCFQQKDWWKRAILYEVYPKSFQDTDGDGIGDIQGITQKLDHFVDLGVESIWITPMYPSGGKDNGYDITNFRGIDATFGTMSDFETLLAEAHKKGIKVLLDLVPNHTSNKHEWFKKSVDGIAPYDDYFVWRDGKGENNTEPPTNWLSVFSGPGWTYNKKRKQFYFHQFYAQQPDLNYRNEAVQREMEDIIRFWLDLGIDGFRVDALQFLVEDATFKDSLYKVGKENSTNYRDQYHNTTTDQPETYETLVRWRKVVDEYTKNTNRTRILVIEVYTTIDNAMQYYRYNGKPAAHYPFNFFMLFVSNKNVNAAIMAKAMNTWIDNLPIDATPNWAYDNHDTARNEMKVGKELSDAYIMMSLLLPGVGITYYGDEIGMENTMVRDDESTDTFRNGQRTPMQWDDSTNAGFTTARKPWLPVNPNYWHLNLEAQKHAEWSHYKLYKRVSEIRRTETIQYGDFKTHVLNNDYVLCLTRFLENKDLYIILVNFNSITETVDLSGHIQHIFDALYVAVPSLNSGYKIGQRVVSKPGFDPKASIVLRPKASLVLIQPADGNPYVNPDANHHADHNDHTQHNNTSSGSKLTSSMLGVLSSLVILIRP